MRAGVASTLRLTAWTALLLVLGRISVALGSGSLDVPLTSLHALRAWIDRASPADMAMALLRLAAITAIAYLLAATLLVVASRLLPVRGLAAFAQGVTPGAVRRLATGGGGLGLALGTVIGALPAPGPTAGPGPPTVVASAADRPAATMTRLSDVPGAARPAAAGDPTTAGRATESVTMTRTTDPWPDTATMSREEPPLAQHTVAADHSAAGSVQATPAGYARDRPASAPDAQIRDDTSWAVEPGDSFWSIAEDVVTPPGGPVPSDRDIGRYWRRLVDANRSRLVDPANPDLLLPGQRLTLPRPDG